jgi:hypothetical protein
LANIGNGRALRVCDLCGGVDDHPRHVLAGQLPGTYQRPGDDIVAQVAKHAPKTELGRLLAELFDTGTSDRHMDCCRAAGCPTGACDEQTVGAEELRGADLLQHLTAAADQRDEAWAGRDSVPALTTIGLALTLLLSRLMFLTRGLSAVNYANKVLDHMHRAVASTAPAGNFAKLHIGDPGASATANASSVTTRPSMTFGAASAGSIAMTNTPQWTNWAGTSPETETDISIWDASSAGTFLDSIQLTASKTVQTGDTLTLTTCTIAFTPIAA